MRRVLIAILTTILIVSNIAYAYPYYQPSMTLYTLDGKSEVVPLDEVAQWQKAGWYTAPVTMMYALDGRQAVVVKTDVEKWKQSGWYTEPHTVVYSRDGESKVIPLDELKKWKVLGWDKKPSMVLYALDGRSEVVPYEAVSEWQKVGWYTAPVTMMYTLDGRQEVVVKTDVEKWEHLGWYKEPSIKMYASDGRSEVVAKKDVEEWKKAGWYDSIPTVKLYAHDGRREDVPVWDVEKWRSVNWLTEKEYNVYLQKNKDYPFFSLESDLNVIGDLGTIKLGMSYLEFCSAYKGEILNESQTTMYNHNSGWNFTLEIDGCEITFFNYYSRYDKNNFTIESISTDSDKWGFGRGIRVGDRAADIYQKFSCFPNSEKYMYLYDSNLKPIDSSSVGSMAYSLEDGEGINFSYGLYRSALCVRLHLGVKNGYINSIVMSNSWC